MPTPDKLPPHFLELASLHRGFPLSGFDGKEGSFSTCPMSIILAANKESLQIDPINWERFIDRLLQLSDDLIFIPQLTDALFRERVSLHTLPALSRNALKVLSYTPA